MTAPKSSGRWVRTAPVRRPPFEPPETASFGRIRVLLRDEPLGRGDEVVEDVLLLLEHPGLVPGVAVLAAAAQVRQGVDAARLEPGEEGGAEARRLADVEAAVAVEERRVACRRASGPSCGRGTSGPSCRPSTGTKTCFTSTVDGSTGTFGRSQSTFFAGEVDAVDAGGLVEGGVGQEGLGPVLRGRETAEPIPGSGSSPRDLAGVPERVEPTAPAASA